MSKILKEVFEELDLIVREEYGRTYALSLFEAEDDDDALSTPISRGASFPARALRFKKAKNVMNKYAKKIISKYDKIIKNFEAGIDKSIPQITKKGEDLQSRLEAAKQAGDRTEVKSIVAQQEKYNDEVKKDLELRVTNLNSAIDNLIEVYTSAIHKRIEEPGYVLKVELSPKGQAELKFLWQEKVAEIKQQGYEKLVRIINNKNIKGLESLIARLEVEIKDEEDERRRWRSSSRSNRSPEEGGSGQDKSSKDPSKGGNKESEYSKLKKYLDDELPNGILEEDEPYKYFVPGKKHMDVYIELDDDGEKITAVFYEAGQDINDNDPVREEDLKDTKDVDDLVDGIEKGEEVESDAERDNRYQEYAKTLYTQLETLFKVRPKYVKDAFDFNFYSTYDDRKKMKELVLYIIGEIADNPEKYKIQEKKLKAESLGDRNLVILFLKKFVPGFEAEQRKNESFLSLDEYKKLNS